MNNFRKLLFISASLLATPAALAQSGDCALLSYQNMDKPNCKSLEAEGSLFIFTDREKGLYELADLQTARFELDLVNKPEVAESPKTAQSQVTVGTSISTSVPAGMPNPVTVGTSISSSVPAGVPNPVTVGTSISTSVPAGVPNPVTVGTSISTSVPAGVPNPVTVSTSISSSVPAGVPNPVTVSTSISSSVPAGVPNPVTVSTSTSEDIIILELRREDAKTTYFSVAYAQSAEGNVTQGDFKEGQSSSDRFVGSAIERAAADNNPDPDNEDDNDDEDNNEDEDDNDDEDNNEDDY